MSLSLQKNLLSLHRQTNKKAKRWQELDSNNSFALKLSDSLDYIIPMFANLIPFLYDIEDIKQLDKSQKEMDNYKLLMMKLELDEDGNYKIDYPEYENYEAIEVNRLVNIPKDYDGVMGVPITFIDKYNPEQFEILGHTSSSDKSPEVEALRTDPNHRNRGLINGKEKYDRILIRRKK